MAKKKSNNKRNSTRGYKKSDLEKKALKAIEEHQLIFISEVHPMIGCSEKTFYNHELQKLQSIKDALLKNRIGTKAELRKKWRTGSNATTQVALYKLIADEDERRRLSIKYENPGGEEDSGAGAIFPDGKEYKF